MRPLLPRIQRHLLELHRQVRPWSVLQRERLLEVQQALFWHWKMVRSFKFAVPAQLGYSDIRGNF